MPKHARQWIWLGLVALTTSGCYHQVVRTGRPAGQTVVDKPWVSGWLFGLVAAPDIDVRAQCPSGVAVVETEQSFVNGLVAALTFGIYTPMHARITCAGGAVPDGALEVSAVGRDPGARQEAINRAVRLSIDKHETVVVRF